jgi:hypothetical protein
MNFKSVDYILENAFLQYFNETLNFLLTVMLRKTLCSYNAGDILMKLVHLVSQHLKSSVFTANF